MSDQTEPNKVGRPTDYTPELAERICTWIAAGKSLRSFVRENEDSPDLSTITRWIVRHGEFRTQYVHAREAAGYAHADAIVEVSEELKAEGIDDRRAKVIIDALKWAAERMAPKAHSPRQEQHHSGHVDVSSMTPEQLSDRAAQLLRKMQEDDHATEEGQQPESDQ